MSSIDAVKYPMQQILSVLLKYYSSFAIYLFRLLQYIISYDKELQLTDECEETAEKVVQEHLGAHSNNLDFESVGTSTFLTFASQ